MAKKLLNNTPYNRKCRRIFTTPWLFVGDRNKLLFSCAVPQSKFYVLLCLKEQRNLSYIIIFKVIAEVGVWTFPENNVELY